MARNKVQFQKGLSEAQFAVLYGTEDQCREAVMRWRWPSGFVCPVCAGQHHSLIKTQALYQCNKHVPRYLAEFEYRFNRRYDLAAMMPRLGYVAVRTPPMPYRLLKLAEDHA